MRDSYRVRQVGHQLQETEVRTIWLFETTPGVSRSKFPVLQHRRRAAGKKQPSRANLSHEGGRFSFPFLVLSCGKKKPHLKSPTHLCLLLGASRGRLGKVLSWGWGPPPTRRTEWGLYPRSRLSRLLAFGPSHILTLAEGPEHQRPGSCTQHPWSFRGPPDPWYKVPPATCSCALVSLPTPNCLCQPRERQLRVGWLRGAERWPSPTTCSAEEPVLIAIFNRSGLLGHI